MTNELRWLAVPALLLASATAALPCGVEFYGEMSVPSADRVLFCENGDRYEYVVAERRFLRIELRQSGGARLRALIASAEWRKELVEIRERYAAHVGLANAPVFVFYGDTQICTVPYRMGIIWH